MPSAILLFFIVIGIGAPVAFALGFAGAVYILLSQQASIAALPTIMFGAMNPFRVGGAALHYGGRRHVARTLSSGIHLHRASARRPSGATIIACAGLVRSAGQPLLRRRLW